MLAPLRRDDQWLSLKAGKPQWPAHGDEPRGQQLQEAQRSKNFPAHKGEKNTTTYIFFTYESFRMSLSCIISVCLFEHELNMNDTKYVIFY